MNIFKALPLLAIIAVLGGGCAPKPVTVDAKIQITPDPAATPAQRTGFVHTQIEVISAIKTLEPVIDRLGLEAKWSTNREACVKKLKAALSVEPVKGTDLLSIQVVADDRKQAANIANAIVETYRDRIVASGGKTPLIHERAE